MVYVYLTSKCLLVICTIHTIQRKSVKTFHSHMRIIEKSQTKKFACIHLQCDQMRYFLGFSINGKLNPFRQRVKILRSTPHQNNLLCFSLFKFEMNFHLYLSWTFCLMSTRFSAQMSLSKYSLSCSVADSKSLWLSWKQNKNVTWTTM